MQSLLFSLFIAFMVMSIAKPIVGRLQMYKIPRTLSALLIFILLIAGIVYGVSWILPPLLEDMAGLFSKLTILSKNYDYNILPLLNDKNLNNYFSGATNQILPFLRNIFSNVVFLVTTFFFSFYFIVEEHLLKDFLKKFFKASKVDRVTTVIERVEKRMSNWFWGELVLMTVIGMMTFVGLSLIGVKHALSLAVIAGLLEAFPVVGPIISAIPATIFAVNQSYFLGLSTVALYIIIQQLENNLIVPTVMKKAIGLNKILILIVLIIGGKLAGVLGIFIAIPLTLAIESILIETVKN